MQNAEIIPNWSIESLDGGTAPRIDSFYGRFHLIYFFNIGCIACKTRAIPFASEIHRAFPEIQISAIHTRFEGPVYSKNQIEEIKLVHKIPYPVYQDSGMKSYLDFKAEGTPHWVLLDKQGRVLRSIFGSQPNALQRLYYLLLELLDNAAEKS